MPALKCEDLNSWRWVQFEQQMMICPDCGAVIHHTPDNLRLHIGWHKGLNIWDPNYQEYIRRRDPSEEGGS